MPSIFGLASASDFTSCHALSFSLEIQCKITLHEPLHICPMQMSPDIDGDTIHVDSMVEVWLGVDQKISGLSMAIPPEKPKVQLPLEVLLMFGQSNPEDGVHGRIIKEHLQNLAQCIDGSNYFAIYLQSNNMVNIAYKKV